MAAVLRNSALTVLAVIILYGLIAIWDMNLRDPRYLDGWLLAGFMFAQMTYHVRRGWFGREDMGASPRPSEPLFILQHPGGRSMKLAFDTDAVVGENANGTRLRYRTNTEPGSSGAPCLDGRGRLVALHHLGDPGWHAPPRFNQGIPIARIAKRIAELAEW